MPQDRRFDPKRRRALKAGKVWIRRDPKQHEPRIKILQLVSGRIGDRCLVQGLTSGRQWLIQPSTLMDTYDPQ